MDYDKFYQWLIEEKSLSNRSAKDVVSRCKRICTKILSVETMSESTIDMLNSNEIFLNCSMFIKSQLRRAVSLYIEFEGERKNG